jgi:hypothetical protein
MLDEPRLLAANPWVMRRPITVSAYHRMGEVGILGERDRIGFWIVDLTSGEVEACRQPKPDGYATTERAGRDYVLEPELLPGVQIHVATLFRT